MAIVYMPFSPAEAQFLASSFPQFVKNNGTNFPVPGLAFDASATETAFWPWTAFRYVSGNVTLDVIWYADTASSGTVRWEATLAAITPNTDTQDVETKAFTTAQTVDTAHLGTTGQRLHRSTVTITNLDSLVALDEVWLRVSRLGADANDTMVGDAILVKAYASYSDT